MTGPAWSASDVQARVQAAVDEAPVQSAVKTAAPPVTPARSRVETVQTTGAVL